jgi:RNA recognition motif-containing protein
LGEPNRPYVDEFPGLFEIRGFRLTGLAEGHRRTDESASYGPKLTGETDECPQQLPSQYIVIRGLEPSVTEEIFAEGVKKLYIESKPEPKKETHKKLKSTAPTARTASLGARPDSLRRVFLVRDKKTNDAMRYGFAEFATLEDAQGAIEKFKASPKFAVSSKPVTAAFIHTGVFIPHTGRVTDENSNFHFQPIYNRDILLKYWDNRVYPSILRVSYDSDAAKQHSVDNTVKSEKTGDEAINAQDASAKKLKRFKINQPAAKPAMVMGPQMQMWARKRAELVGQAQAQVELDANNNAASIPAPSEKGRGSSRTQAKDSYISYSDTDNLACLVCLRKFSSLVALRDHEALNKDHVANLLDEGKRDAAAERLRSQAKRPQVVTLRVANVSRQPSDLVYTSYADRDQLHCLICQRKFAKAAMLSLHERESEMHRLNLGDQGNIDRAISQLARIGKAPRKMVPAKNKGKRYRDRAKERRQAFKQPNAPRRKAPKKDAVPKEAEKPAAPSKGAALLGKMGWSAGEGLGAEGSGRTEVIATDVYASGVGLGAEGGRLGDAVEEAARKTKDNYTDFVEVTRKKARERYEKLG